jgi:type III secretion system low calcium response chaperone LcrH/SycD
MSTARDDVLRSGASPEEVSAALVEAIERGATIKDIHGVSQETMDGLYWYAYDFYKKGRLGDAEIFFRFLCIYDFYNSEYVMGLGAVCQLKKNYVRAIDLYALAFALSKNDYRPMFYAGQCQLMRGKAALARECFQNVVDSSHDEHLKQMAASYLEGLSEIESGGRRKRGP